MIAKILLTKHVALLIIGGEIMASRKCNTTSTKKTSNQRSSNRTEASTDNAKSRTTAKQTSRTKNCN